MSKFITGLDILCSEVTERLWELGSPLVYESDLLKVTVTVPKGFVTDLASVPRVPILFEYWGYRAHREAVIHDYLYRTDSIPLASFRQANATFLEAMACRGKAFAVRWGMFWGVWLGGYFEYHKKPVSWTPEGTTKESIIKGPPPASQEPADVQTPEEKAASVVTP
jgi:Protein of unknown function (DUF1353)